MGTPSPGDAAAPEPVVVLRPARPWHLRGARLRAVRELTIEIAALATSRPDRVAEARARLEAGILDTPEVLAAIADRLLAGPLAGTADPDPDPRTDTEAS